MTGSVRGEISVGDAETPAWAEDLGGRKSVERRLMPEGMEWPRFEDGEPLSFGCEYLNSKGNAATLRSVLIKDLRDVLGGDIFWRLGKGANAVELKNGERVKRHAPKVLDADGVEIREGDVLYSVETGDYVVVDSIEPGNSWFATAGSELQHCAKFTHQRPALDADGVQIKKGDTVYLLPGKWCDVYPCCGFHGGEELEVRETYTTRYKSGGILCWSKHNHSMICYPQPSHLTHTKPEPPDSWERIEEDKDLNPFEYCKEVGHKLDTCENAERFKANDIVRRCKALAERGE